jgi:hypothetical protein
MAGEEGGLGTSEQDLFCFFVFVSEIWRALVSADYFA